MPRAKCPRCSTVVEYTPPAKPSCSQCGFGTPARAATPAAAPRAAPSMLAPKPAIVGKPRGYWVTILLIFVTLGIYALVYSYKVFKELDTQHAKEHKSVFFWLSLIPYLGIVFSIIYFVKEIPQLNSYRQAHGLPPGITAGKFYAWTFLGALILIGPYVALYKLNKSANEVWQRVYAESGVPYPA